MFIGSVLLMSVSGACFIAAGQLCLHLPAIPRTRTVGAMGNGAGKCREKCVHVRQYIFIWLVVDGLMMV